MPASSRRFPLREKQSGRRSRCARHCLKVFSPPACRTGYQTLQVGSTMQFLPWKYPTPSSVAPARNRNVCSGAAGRRAAPPRGCACASSLPYSHSCRLTSTFSGVLPSLVFLSPGCSFSLLFTKPMCTDVETKTSSLLVQYVILQQNRKKLPAQP